MNCLAIRIPSLSITGGHPRSTGGLDEGGAYYSVEEQSAYSTAQTDKAAKKEKRIKLRRKRTKRERLERNKNDFKRKKERKKMMVEGNES